MIWLLLLISLINSSPPDDDFYNPPSNLSDYALGEIIRSRQSPHPITSMFINPLPIVSSHQLLIRSQDTFQNPTAIITTILIPPNPDPNKLISHQPFENSAMQRCAPSYAMSTPNFETFQIQTDLVFIAAMLSQGWYVNVPDHEGANSAFLAGIKAGYSVLDSIRGAQSFLKLKSRIIGLFGYSGGGFSSIWASMLVSTYAPELNIVGLAGGGTIVNITLVMETVDSGLYSGLIVNMLQGLSNEYGDFKEALMKYGEIQPLHCLFPSAKEYFLQKIIGGVYDRDLLFDEIIRKKIMENDLISSLLVPSVPVFLFHSRIDEMSPFEEVLKLKEYWCSRNVSLELAEDMSYNHMVGAYMGAPAAITWLEQRLNGSLVSGCIHEFRLTNLGYPGVVPTLRTFFERTLQLFQRQS
ncbi:LIP7 Lipase 7 [Candida maltosa Xu316]